MGFPSPAADYAEKRISLDDLPGMVYEKQIMETDYGYDIIVPVTRKPLEGDEFVVRICGEVGKVKLTKGRLVTKEGHTLTSDEQDEMEVLGLIIYELRQHRIDLEGDWPF